jgi:hypothetical protein
MGTRWPSLLSVASIGDAHGKLMEEASPGLSPPSDHIRTWGPILKANAEGCGAPAPAASVLLRPTDIALVNAARSVLALLPDALIPKSSDTATSLAQRLKQSDFLDPTQALSKGNGSKGLVALNASTYPQPRRKCWSVTADETDASLATNHNQVVGLLAYRTSDVNFHSTPMPLPVFDLGVELWKVAWPYLSEVCKKQPMNHCELLCYYTLFKGHMGRHRDNFVARDLRDYLEKGIDPRTRWDGKKKAQVADSNVLIWSMGNASMQLSLSFSPPDGDPGDSTTYEVHPLFQVTLLGGTLFVFAPLDDLFFCHESEFLPAVLEAAGAAGHRFAFVYRWLTQRSIRQFDVHSGAMVLSPEAEAERAQKVSNKARLKRRRNGVF